MILYEQKERDGLKMALAAEEFFGHHSDLSGWWDLVGCVKIERGGGLYKGVSSDQILDGIDNEGVFIWTVEDVC